MRGAWNEPDASFADWIHRHMDWPRVCDYLALQTLCHRSEIESNDYFFIRIQKKVSGRSSPGITTTATLPCLPTRTDCTNPISPSFPRPCSPQGGKYLTATSFTRESFVIRSCELPIFVALKVCVHLGHAGSIGRSHRTKYGTVASGLSQGSLPPSISG